MTRYDYEITVNQPDETEFEIRGSCYGSEYMIKAIELHCPDYTSAVITFVPKHIEKSNA